MRNEGCHCEEDAVRRGNLNFEKLTLKDKELFEEFRTDPLYTGSDLEFAGAYIWNLHNQAKFCVFKDILIVSGKFFLHEVFYPPIPRDPKADLTEAVEEIRKYCKAADRKFIIKALTDDMLSRIDGGVKGRYLILPDRDFYDYVYDAKELIDLPTPKFHDKKNHLHQFLTNYKSEYRAYRDGDFDQVLELFDEWAAGNPDKVGVNAERQAVVTALKHLKHADLKAGVIAVDGRVRAFSVGSVAKVSQTGVVYFEKADTRYKGIYAAINNFFAKQYFSSCKYINRQEDMGIEGLRRAKLSYNPVFLVEKSILTE